MTTQTSRAGSVFGTQPDSDEHPRMDVKRPNPQVEAVIGKLVSPTDRSVVEHRRNRTMRSPDMAILQKISDTTAGNVAASNSLLQLLPDTELTMQILVSSILSPKDMVKSELAYSVDPNQFRSEISGTMLECIRDYFQNVYKMDELLPTILEDALFLKGSYPMLVLPENSIDDAINSDKRVSMESVRGELAPDRKSLLPMGLLGKPKTDGESTDHLGLESIGLSYQNGLSASATYDPAVRFGAFDPKLAVVDNFNVLKMPLLQEKVRQDRIQDVLAVRKVSMEAMREESAQDRERSLYRRRRHRHIPVMAITPPSHLKKKSVGHPLTMHLPPEAVIPVHVPSNPRDHLGYFVLLDQAGNPLSKVSDVDFYADMQQQLQNNSEHANQLIASARTSTHGVQDVNSANRQIEVTEMERIYGDLVEQELLGRLRSGVYGENVEVSRPTEVYRIMLARAMAKQNTQALYVPAELMSYFAFDFDQFGVGQSLLQKSKVIGSLRASLLMANTLASLKNSVGRVNLNITLDPNDDDPASTVEFMLTEFAKTRQSALPLGVARPHDIATALQNSAVEVTVQGNQAYPETKLSVEDKQSSRAKPDPDLEKAMRDRHLMSMGVSPETVDAGANAEFAVSVTNNNLLLTKRVMLYQGALIPQVEEFLQRYTLNSSALMDQLRQIVKDNLDKLTEEQRAAMQKDKTGQDASGETEEISVDGVIVDFVHAVRLALPSPDLGVLENQMKAFDAYVEALDKSLKAFVDSEFLEGTTMGKMADVMAPTIAAVRAYFIRQWLRDNNVMPELDALTTFSDEDGPAIDLLETHTAHVESIGKVLVGYMEKIAKARSENDKKVDAIEAANGGAPEPSSTDTGDTGGDAGGSDDNLDVMPDGLGGDPDADGNADAGDDAGEQADDADKEKDTDADAKDEDKSDETADKDADEHLEKATAGLDAHGKSGAKKDDDKKSDTKPA